jgi:small subunit ribosomal protein S8
MTDPIADYLTRLRNAIMAKHRIVEIPASNLKKEITKILFEKGYILNYKFVEDGPQGTIKVALKYDAVNKVNAIKKLIRVSRPGMRKYTGYRDAPCHQRTRCGHHLHIPGRDDEQGSSRA